MHYILQNRNPFIKLHIALLSPSANFSWLSCVSAGNAGMVGANQLEAGVPATTTCGFMRFNEL